MMDAFEKWVEIDLDKVAHNVREIKKHLSKDTLLIAVVKGNAYGHGIENVSRVALENGADWLCVADQFEGKYLRKLGFRVPILVLSPPSRETAEIAVSHDLIQGIDSIEQIRFLDKLSKMESKKTIVHIKVDTGLGRFGIRPEETADFAHEIRRFKNIQLQGVYTHFASPYGDSEYTKYQFDRFIEVQKTLQQNRISVDVFHCANSPASMDFPYMHMDAVRIGFSLCNRCIGLEKSKQWNLVDALEFKAKVKKVRTVSPGDHIGYENQFIADKKMKFAIIPVGYADGIPTALANRGHVLIRGKKLRLIGSVCFNQGFVDLTEFGDVSIGDEVVLIGGQGKERLTYRDIARGVDAGNSETILRISGAVPRIFYKNGKVFAVSSPS
jgi:alanine racemase